MRVSSTRRKYSEMHYERKYLLDPNYMTKRELHHYYHYYDVTKNRTQLKKLIAIFCFICFFSYVFIDFNLKTKFTRLKDRFDFSPKVEALPESNVTQAYFVDTSGCRMPFFNTIDDTILQYMFKIPKFTCHKSLVQTTTTNDADLLLHLNRSQLFQAYNISDLSKVLCYYQEFARKTDTRNEYDQHRYELNLQSPTRVIPTAEFVKVVCQLEESKPFYKDFHFFAIHKKSKGNTSCGGSKSADKKTINVAVQTPERSFTNSSRKGISKKPHPARAYRPHLKNDGGGATSSLKESRKISVMIIGIDSVSRLNFLRQMKRTAEMIHNHSQFRSVEFTGYNKVGDNTYPNLVPALSGLDETELNLSCLSPSHGKNVTYDKCAFIWRRYKEAGYSTVFAEDVANLGLFNYFRNGFKEQPTDYYLRPIIIEMERYIAYKKKANMRLCLGGRRAVDIVLELIRKLIPFFQHDLFFSFFWMASLTHDFFNMPVLLDDDIADLFEALHQTNVLNRTILFFMSDHGLRWGSFRKTYQGMMEERQPLLVSIFPPWFARTYPEAVANMQTNSKRLTTHYDLHATLSNLLDLSTLEKDQMQLRTTELLEADTIPRGISLFLPIPMTRTCENAGIASHWCTCHQKETLPTNDARVQRAARYIVKLINDKLRAHPKCRVLYLNAIPEAIIGSSHQKILKEVTSDYLIDITVRVQTKPGLGEFESTVRMSSYTTHLTGTISRINMYGSQSYCIDDYTLKMFCYCHR